MPSTRIKSLFCHFWAELCLLSASHHQKHAQLSHQQCHCICVQVSPTFLRDKESTTAQLMQALKAWRKAPKQSRVPDRFGELDNLLQTQDAVRCIVEYEPHGRTLFLEAVNSGEYELADFLILKLKRAGFSGAFIFNNTFLRRSRDDSLTLLHFAGGNRNRSSAAKCIEWTAQAALKLKVGADVIELLSLQPDAWGNTPAQGAAACSNVYVLLHLLLLAVRPQGQREQHKRMQLLEKLLKDTNRFGYPILASAAAGSPLSPHKALDTECEETMSLLLNTVNLCCCADGHLHCSSLSLCACARPCKLSVELHACNKLTLD